MLRAPSRYRFANLSLRYRLLLFFLLVSILPILLIGIIAYSISFNVITNMAKDSSMEMIDRVDSEMSNLLTDTYKISAIISNDPVIQQKLRQPLPGDIKQRYSSDLEIDTKLNFISSYRNDFFGYYVFGENGSASKSNFYTLQRGDFRLTNWYRKIMASDRPVWFGKHQGSFASETVGQQLITVGFPIFDIATGNRLGVVLIDIEEGLLSRITFSNFTKKGYMFIQDDRNQIIANPDTKLNLQDIPQFVSADVSRSGEMSITQNKRYMMIHKISSVTGWKIVGVISYKELTKESRAIGVIIAGTFVVISILALLVSWQLASSVSNPIRRLMLLMRRAEEGNMTVTMNVKYNDEIGLLGRSFNHMIAQISRLMNEVYEEQQALRKTELKALQAQINPHFLYNTLDSIIWLARANRKEELIEIVTALTKQFRIALSRGRDIITLQDELEHVRNYLRIQQLRYTRKLDYRIDVPEELLGYPVLKLILQPLVENALYHGIKLKREKGCISITGTDAGDHIVLEVADTGKGMTREQLEALNNTLSKNEGAKLDSYGVKNVHERIQIFFGSMYGLVFESEPDVGTKVSIRIPKLLEGDEDVRSHHRG